MGNPPTMVNIFERQQLQCVSYYDAKCTSVNLMRTTNTLERWDIFLQQMMYVLITWISRKASLAQR